MIEWQPYDKQKAGEVFDRGSSKGDGRIAIDLETTEKDGEWFLHLGHMLPAKANTEQEAGRAFGHAMAKAREILPPGRVRMVLDD